MKSPKEIVDAFKSILLSSEEVIKQPVEEVVELAEEEVIEEAPVVEEEVISEDSDIESLNKKYESLYEELSSLKASVKQMMEIVSPTEEKDVPAELSKQEVVSEVTELSVESEEIVHSPEAQVEQKKQHLYSQSRPKTVKHSIYNKLFNK
jgi:hypothetical protein|tara:strand:- start:645 stop:1094 length:450 start_codon:yes stop_codon:yes gene_type:complete